MHQKSETRKRQNLLKKKIRSKKNYCNDCKIQITHTYRSVKRCIKCNIIERKRIKKATATKARNAKMEKNPRTCIDCQICITYLNKRRTRCKKCSSIENKRKVKIRLAQYRTDPEYRKMQAAETTRRTRILVSTPEGRKEHNAKKLKYRTNNTGSAIRGRMKRDLRYTEAKKIGPLPSKQKMFDRQCGICPYTGLSMHKIPLNELHIDHMTPLANGGENTSDNLCLTFPCCNLSKGSKLFLVWMASPLYKAIIKRCTHGDIF